MNAQTNNKENRISTRSRGFTIIEVVLVLAIAALIFLMVFIALPALQRGQANSARKNDASTIVTAIGTYRSNHNGELPDNAADITKYLDKLSQVDKASIAFASGAGTFSGDSNLDKAKVFKNAKCNGDNQAVAGTSRQAAVITVVETSAGNYDSVCSNA